MTLCLASVADQLKAVVLVSDTKFTITRRDGRLRGYDAIAAKGGYLSRAWRCFSAGDATVGELIYLFAREHMEHEPHLTSPPLDYAQVVMKRAYNVAWQRSINDHFLMRYRKSYRQYLVEGRTFFDRFGDVEAARINGKIEKWDLKLDLMVCGFSERWPHVFAVVNPGAILGCDNWGYYAIGDHDDIVRNWLFQAKPSTKDVLDAIIDLLTCKFTAELMTHSIGRVTFVSVLFRDGEIILTHDALTDIHDYWDTHRDNLNHSLMRELTEAAVNRAITVARAHSEKDNRGKEKHEQKFANITKDLSDHGEASNAQTD